MYFVDVQGTLISDDTKEPIEGAIELIDYLNENNLPYVVITNNTKSQSREFLSYLQSIGLNIADSRYLDPLMTLQSHVSLDKKIATFGPKTFEDSIKSLGYEIDFKTPDVVLVAISSSFSSDDYASMIELLLAGAELVGMHETTIYASKNRRYPGLGAILQMLSFATSKPYSVVGKPSEPFFNKALDMIREQHSDASFDKITIISDDLVGDIVGARRLGMRGIFVLSGKIKDADEIIPHLLPQNHPDAIYKDVGEVLKSL